MNCRAPSADCQAAPWRTWRLLPVAPSLLEGSDNLRNSPTSLPLSAPATPVGWTERYVCWQCFRRLCFCQKFNSLPKLTLAVTKATIQFQIIDFDGGQQHFNHSSSFGSHLHEMSSDDWQQIEDSIRQRTGKVKSKMWTTVYCPLCQPYPPTWTKE